MFSVPSISSGAVPALSITNSVRLFTDNYFVRSSWGTATDRKKFTFSCWFKKHTQAANQVLLYGLDGVSANPSFLRFTASDQLEYQHGGAAANNIISTDVFRDDTGHYHIVVALDTTQATAADRVKIWVNGRLLTSFGTTNYPALNATHTMMTNGNNSYIGGIGGTGSYCGGYISEVHFLDGTAKTAADFGQENQCGQWEPIAYGGGSYGTNGWYLDFADGSAATAAALGDDASGNTNDWTPTNISVTAGTANDFLQDTHTTNYPIMTTLANVNSSTVSEAGMSVQTSVAGTGGTRASIAIPKTGKWYFEGTLTATGGDAGIGLFRVNGSETTDHYVFGANGLGYYQGALKFTYSASAAYGNTFTTNDIIGVAVDCDNDKVWFSKNGTWQASGDPPNGTNPAFSGQGVNSASYDFFPTVSDGNGSNSCTWHMNFGQRAFNTAAPSGFSALCVANFHTPTIEYTTDYVNVKQYGGTGSSQSITF